MDILRMLESFQLYSHIFYNRKMVDTNILERYVILHPQGYNRIYSLYKNPKLCLIRNCKEIPPTILCQLKLLNSDRHYGIFKRIL